MGQVCAWGGRGDAVPQGGRGRARGSNRAGQLGPPLHLPRLPTGAPALLHLVEPLRLEQHLRRGAACHIPFHSVAWHAHTVRAPCLVRLPTHLPVASLGSKSWSRARRVLEPGIRGIGVKYARPHALPYLMTCASLDQLGAGRALRPGRKATRQPGR